ncbi:hypothetical protein COL516b_010497 [Colletotrichum fioriniae]|nr:uncharacterized protein COL516b_010497 [Colletotrichum fioriniae]KAJ0297645.1 hypothetical protein COL516b_010497 [Colletotrichum fioriniae]
MADRYKLAYSVPRSHLDATKAAIFEAGGGTYDNGKYVHVAFESPGTCQFIPVSAAGATPHTGAIDRLAQVPEYKVEILCVGRDVTREAVSALKRYLDPAMGDSREHWMLTKAAERIHTRCRRMKCTNSKTSKV